MIKCEKCGAVYETEEYVFCPECGGKLEPEKEAEKPEEPKAAETVPEKKKSKKPLVICAVAAAAVIAVIAWLGITTPRELVLNGNEEIKVGVGETMEVSAYADGLTEEDYQQIQWTTSGGTFEDNGGGSFTVEYNKNDFSPSDSEDVPEDLDENSYEAFVSADLKKGLRSWHGEVRVIVSLEPVKFKTGKVILEPETSCDGLIRINPSEKFHSYFYLESEDDKDSDISFVVKKGETAEVEVPCDTFTIYEADGTEWYGDQALFGPSTSYYKWNQSLEVTEDSLWTLTVEAENGNVGSEGVDPEDFPDAQ